MADKKRILILTGVYTIILLYAASYYTCSLIDKAAVTSFKKLYASYTQALYSTVYQMDGDTGCYFSSDKYYKNDFKGCDRFYKVRFKFESNQVL